MLKIKDMDGNTTERCGRMVPAKNKLYLSDNDDGYNNMGDRIEAAAKAAGRYLVDS